MLLSPKQRKSAQEILECLEDRFRSDFEGCQGGINRLPFDYLCGILEGISNAEITQPQPQLWDVLKTFEKTKDFDLGWLARKISASGLSSEVSHTEIQQRNFTGRI